MLKDKVLALVKSLHQRPRSRLLPLPDFAAEFCETAPFAQGNLVDMLLKAVRERTQLAVQRNDFKLDTLSPHHFMNLRVVDEHGRQLAMGRHLATLKTAWGGQARSAFQALAALKLASATSTSLAGAGSPRSSGSAAAADAGGPVRPVQAAGGLAAAGGEPRGGPATGDAAGAARGRGVTAEVLTRARGATPREATSPPPAEFQGYTAWTFGQLPELLELRKGGQTLIGFPALIDKGAHVEIEVFDEPDVAAAKHRVGLRRLVGLQIREPLRYLEKNIPELQKMAAAYLPLGTLEELRTQIVDLAVDRAFLADPLPTDERGFKARIDEGRARLTLIAQEVARLAGTVLAEYAAATRKLKDSRPPKDVAEDVGAQLQRLVGKRFLLETAWPALHHLPRYLRAVVLRLDKQRVDPARDAARLAELRPLEQRWLKRVIERKAAADARLDDYRWLLEELRVSFFAQELRTPQPVSVKRLDKAWQQLSS